MPSPLLTDNWGLTVENRASWEGLEPLTSENTGKWVRARLSGGPWVTTWGGFAFNTERRWYFASKDVYLTDVLVNGKKCQPKPPNPGWQNGYRDINSIKEGDREGGRHKPVLQGSIFRSQDQGTTEAASFVCKMRVMVPFWSTWNPLWRANPINRGPDEFNYTNVLESLIWVLKRPKGSLQKEQTATVMTMNKYFLYPKMTILIPQVHKPTTKKRK